MRLSGGIKTTNQSRQLKRLLLKEQSKKSNRRLPAPLTVSVHKTIDMYLLHVFPTSEYQYDVVTGIDSELNHTFPSKEAAEFWFKEEFGDSGWSFLGDDELQLQRAEFKSFSSGEGVQAPTTADGLFY